MDWPDNISSPSNSSSTSSGSNKRKSFGDINDENANHNVQTAEKECPPSSSKKFKDALLSGSTAIVNGSNLFLNAVIKGAEDANMTLRSKSSLPRFNPAKKAPTTPLQKKRIVTEHSTAERSSSLRSNRKSVMKAPREESIPTPARDSTVLLRRLKKCISHNPSTDVLRGHFEGGFTVNEEKIGLILSHLKVKSKWDLKEKTKKQEAVVKELRDCLITTIAEIRTVRESCLLHEDSTNNILRDCYEELVGASQSVAELRLENQKLSHELNKAQEELRHATSSMMKFKTDQSPLRNRAKESEQRLADLSSQLTQEQARAVQLEGDWHRAEKELADIKWKSESAIALQKEEFEQRLDQSVLGYREEVATLRAELSRRQCDADRYNDEKSDLDKRKIELQEEIMLTQSRVREAENAAVRYEKEIERCTSELDRLREQLTLKDADLRCTINSLQDIQKQGCDEKNGLRAELSSLQSRVQMLEEERLSLTSQLATKKEEFLSQTKEIVRLQEAVVQLEGKLFLKESEVLAAKDCVMQLEVEKELRARCEVREEAERRERIAAMSQLLATQTECNNRIREIEEKKAISMEAMQASCAEANRLRDASNEECRRQTDRAAGLVMEVQQLHVELEHASVNHESAEKLSRVTGELEVMRRRLLEMSESQAHQSNTDAQRIAEYEEKLRAGESQRRKLHNLVQELRGNVRVFARVRPFLPNDGFDLQQQLPEPTITVRTDANSLRIARSQPTISNTGGATGSNNAPEDYSFSFDKVFGPSSSQESLFQEVSEFVQSALDGYNVCLFSYGQTGSGKTHTMQGSGTGSMRGVIPRAMQQVGIYKKELEAKGWDYQMEVSFIEIYNETIRDLLRSNSSSSSSSSNTSISSQHDDAASKLHEIKKDAQGNVYISDVTMVKVNPNDVEQVDGIMEQAARHRSVGQTAMNERSSRSHSVFTLHLKASNASQGILLKGTLSLVDLAGSERLDRSMAVGDQLKETVAINKSLSALTDVFVAIGNKQSHIPFRNSKLTYLLQPALSGDGKTLMMVNLSPTEESFHESLCSLRLAKQVNQCELGRPKKQVKEVSNSSALGNSSSNTTIATTTSSSSNTNTHPSTTMTNMTHHNTRIGGTLANTTTTPSRPIRAGAASSTTQKLSSSLNSGLSSSISTASVTPQSTLNSSLGSRRTAAPSSGSGISKIARKAAH